MQTATLTTNVRTSDLPKIADERAGKSVQITGAWRSGRGLDARLLYMFLSFPVETLIFVDCTSQTFKTKPNLLCI